MARAYAVIVWRPTVDSFPHKYRLELDSAYRHRDIAERRATYLRDRYPEGVKVEVDPTSI